MAAHNHEQLNRTLDHEPSVDHVHEMGARAIGETLREGPSYKFIFCLHAPENSHAIANELRDCEILAFEGTGGTTEERLRREDMYTNLLSSELPEDVRIKALDMLAKGSESDAFMSGILAELGSTDKKVVFVDAEADSSEHRLLDEMDRADERYRIGIADNNLNDELRRLLIEDITASANASRSREEVVVPQLEELQSESVEKVGAVVGAVHSFVQHTLARDGYKTDRVFIGTEFDSEKRANERKHYGYRYDAMRQVRIHPDLQLAPALIDRVLLGDMYYTYTYGPEDDGMSETYRKALKKSKIDSEIIENMTDVEVSSFLQKIDDLKQAGKKGIIRTKNSKIQRQVKGLLDENQRTVLGRIAA